MKRYLLFFLVIGSVYTVSGMQSSEGTDQPSIAQIKIEFSGIVMVNIYDMFASLKPGGTPGKTLSFMGPHVKGRRVTYDVAIPLTKTSKGNGKNIVVIARGINGDKCNITGFGFGQLSPNSVLVIDKNGKATIEQQSAETKGVPQKEKSKI